MGEDIYIQNKCIQHTDEKYEYNFTDYKIDKSTREYKESVLLIDEKDKSTTSDEKRVRSSYLIPILSFEDVQIASCCLQS